MEHPHKTAGFMRSHFGSWPMRPHHSHFGISFFTKLNIDQIDGKESKKGQGVISDKIIEKSRKIFNKKMHEST